MDRNMLEASQLTRLIEVIHVAMILEVIYQTLTRVFHHVSKHRERKLNAEFFNKSSRCLET